MFVLLGPDFEGTPEAYQRLARATGLVAYDLRSRLRPGSWGLVKALADEAQAVALARALSDAHFRPILIDRAVAHDNNRPIVPVRSVALTEQNLVLGLQDRDMTVEFAALACVIRGEVQPGRSVQRGTASGPSSGNYRAVTAPADVSVAINVVQSPFEAFQAADLHFLTALWVARLDLHSLGGSAHEATPRVLDGLADELARRAGSRVDRNVRTSSVASLAEQATPKRGSEPPNVREARREQADERFDAYSRIIGEAERMLRARA
jgi:hypothetical protein